VSSRPVAYAQKRRSTRIDQAVPVAVQGLGAFREPYQEQVSTLTISCHGCAYQSKYEVIQGEVVYLDVKSPTNGSSNGGTRARVKWVQNLGAKGGFQIAVELEVAGNIWGIASPPEDWFPLRVPIAIEPAAPGRELRVVGRTELQNSGGLQVQPAPVAPAQDERFGHVTQLERNASAESPFSSLAQMMASMGEQIQVMASKAATMALTEQKSRLLDEFRVNLREEAVKAIQAVMFTAKENFTRLALKELNEAHEAGARANYARWIIKIEQDMEVAKQQMTNQAQEASQRLNSMAASTIERVQHSMEASRSEAVDRFVSRLREQIAPMFAEARDTLQTLAASETAFKNESHVICARLESQIERSANSSLAKVHGELDKNSAAVAAKTTETLLILSQDLEKAARDNLRSLLASMGSDVTMTLQDRTAQISREFSIGLEAQTRSYLEFIAKSIAEIAKHTPGHSRE
jgi:hypothetical protein